MLEVGYLCGAFDSAPPMLQLLRAGLGQQGR